MIMMQECYGDDSAKYVEELQTNAGEAFIIVIIG